MGIKNFVKLVKKYAPGAIKYTKIEDYKGKFIGIDANLMLYKIIMAIKANGYDITKGNKVVTHIHAILLKLIKFKKLNIIPVFVFDSDMPEIKYDTMKKREDTKNKLIEKYKNGKTDEEKRKYFYMSSYLTSKEIDDCRHLIEIFNYPIIQAEEEADAQLVKLQNDDLIDYIATDDMDVLLFGGKNVIKNFSVSDKKTMMEINKEKLLSELKITHDQLIEIGILLGSDYCDNPKMSIDKSYKLITEHKTISKIPKDIIDTNCDHASNYFKNPPVKKILNISGSNNVNNKMLISMLSHSGYSEEEIDGVLKKIE